MAASDPLIKPYRLRRGQWNIGQEIVIAGGHRELEGYTFQSPVGTDGKRPILPFGVAVSYGSVVAGIGDSHGNDYTCIIGGSDFVGVATANKARTGTQEEGYANDINVPVLMVGHIYVQTDVTDVVRGNDVWYNKTDGTFSNTPVGAGAPDSTTGLSTTHVNLPNARFKSSGKASVAATTSTERVINGVELRLA